MLNKNNFVYKFKCVMYTHYLSCLQLKNFCHLPEIYPDTQKSFFLAAKTDQETGRTLNEYNTE